MTSDHSMYAEKTDAYFENPRTEIAPLLPDQIDRVLEIGCGAGATLRWLRIQRSIHYAAGVELSPKAAERAEAIFDVVRSGNIETMELPTGPFDLIIALDVLEHLVDPWVIMKRLQAILSPGGAIIVSIPNISHYSVCIPLLLGDQWNYTDDGLLDRTHLRFFTRQTAVNLVTGSGFVIDKIEHVRRGPQFGSAKKRWYSLKVLNWILPGHLLDWQFLIRVKAA